MLTFSWAQTYARSNLSGKKNPQVASRMYHPPNHHHLFNSIQIQTQGCESGITEATVGCGANFVRIVTSPVERFMRLTVRLVVGERGQERANESKLTAAAHGHSKQSGERHLLDSQSLLDHLTILTAIKINRERKL